MVKWKVHTQSGRAGNYVEADTEEEALQKARIHAYYPLTGAVTGVTRWDHAYEDIDTTGD